MLIDEHVILPSRIHELSSGVLDSGQRRRSCIRAKKRLTETGFEMRSSTFTDHSLIHMSCEKYSSAAQLKS